MKAPRNLIGGQLQKVRMEKGISQEQLAAVNQRKGWNISRYVIAKIESRRRWVSDFELVLLAESLGVSPVELFPTQRMWLASRKHFTRDRTV